MKIVYLFLFFSGFFNCIPHKCECSYKSGLIFSYMKCDLLVEGELIQESRYLDSVLEYGYNFNDSIRKFKFRVLRTLKGQTTGNVITVITPNNFCGELFFGSSKYLIFLDGKFESSIGVYRTSSCYLNIKSNLVDFMQLKSMRMKN